MLHPHQMYTLAKLDHTERLARSRTSWLLAANPPARGRGLARILPGWPWLRRIFCLRRDPARPA